MKISLEVSCEVLNFSQYFMAHISMERKIEHSSDLFFVNFSFFTPNLTLVRNRMASDINRNGHTVTAATNETSKGPVYVHNES